MNDSNCPSVAVLMSTYNGEKYLREQVDSILNQKDVDVHLYVRDDGSTDGTLDIVREYIAANPGKISLTTGENLGVGRSFMELVYQSPSTYDYYAFSDQDDVWLEGKLIAAIRFLTEHHKALYVGNLMCVDKNLNKVKLRNSVPPDISLYAIMVANEINGCTMVFSQHFCSFLKDESHRPDGEALFYTRCHDTWVAMVGALMGVLVYDFDYHILYRQHEGNVVGSTNYSRSIGYRIIKYSKIIRGLILDKSKRNGRSRAAHEIVRVFPEESARFPYLWMYAEPQKLENKVKLIRSYKEYCSHTPIHHRKGFLGFFLYVCFNLI